ncbi:MAG: ribosome modulation factor [Cupriavidus necator]
MANFERRGHTVRALVRMKGQRISATFDSEKAARDWARKTEKRINEGETIRKFDDTSDPSVASVLERYSREVSCNKLSVATEQLAIRALLRDFPQFFSKRISEFRTDEVEAFIKARLASKNKNKPSGKVGTATVIREIAVLSTAFAYAIKRWKMPFHDAENPVKGIDRPKQPEHRTRRVAPDEVARICTRLGYVDGTRPETNRQWIAWAFKFCLATAMRKGEALAMTWEHVHMDELYVHLPRTKNGSSRDVPLSPAAIELLSCLKPGTGAQAVLPIGRATIDSAFGRAKRALGIVDLHWHDSRHEATTQIAKDFANSLELAAITGHKSLSMLKCYFNPTPTEMAQKMRGTKPSAPVPAPVLQQDPKAWKAGYRAGLLGKPVTTCPYASTSMEGWSWMSGYLEGSNEQAANDAA